MVDLGISFADETLPGVEIVLPDPRFIEARSEDLCGLVLTHAHEDHFGAIPYLWQRLRCPIWCTRFTAAVLRRKLEDSRLKGVPINVVAPGERFRVGPFDCALIQVTHSIPEAHALALRTPLGNVLHTGDWKLDPAPLIGALTGTDALEAFGHEGVLAMVGDSTNILNPGTSGSEAEVRDSLMELVGRQSTPGRDDHLRLQRRAPRDRDQGRGGDRARGRGGRALDAADDRGRARGRLSAGHAGPARRAHRGRTAARAGAVARDRLPGRAARGADPDRRRPASDRRARAGRRGDLLVQDHPRQRAHPLQPAQRADPRAASR